MERLGNVQAREEVEEEHREHPREGQVKDKDEDDDENETCGFCKFMKSGGCRQAFIVSEGACC